MEPPPRAYVEHSLSASSKLPRPLKPSTPCNQPTLPTAVKSRTPPCGAGLGGVGGLNLAWSASAGIRQAEAFWPVSRFPIPASLRLGSWRHPSIPTPCPALRPHRKLGTVDHEHASRQPGSGSHDVARKKHTCLQRVTTSLSPPPPPPRESSGPRQQVY
jgi:hypothetical protein